MEGNNVLGGESQDQASVEELKQQLLEKEEQLKKLQSDTDRGVQKVLSEKKYLQMVVDVAKDNTKLLEIMESDQDLAKRILEEHYDGISMEEAEKVIKSSKGYQEKPAAPGVTKEEIKEMLQQEKVNDVVAGFIKESKLGGEDLDAFTTEFEDLVSGKKLTEASAKKFLKIAYKEAFPTKDLSEIERDAKDMAIGDSSGGKKGRPSKSDQFRKSGIEYLKQQGIL